MTKGVSASDFLLEAAHRFEFSATWPFSEAVVTPNTAVCFFKSSGRESVALSLKTEYNTYVNITANMLYDAVLHSTFYTLNVFSCVINILLI